MSEAETLIALEAALAELSELYLAARGFVALREAAESELLPRSRALGSTLRARLRRGALHAGVLDEVTCEIAALRASWRQRLTELTESPLYREAREAWETADIVRSAALLPRVVAGISPATVDAPLHHGVSAMQARRRTGAPPFMTPQACAEQVTTLYREGISAPHTGREPWERELTYVELFADPGAIDTPIALRIDPHSSPLCLFRASGAEDVRLYARQTRVPFTVLLDAELADEWWQAYDLGRSDFLDSLSAQLRERGIPVERR